MTISRQPLSSPEVSAPDRTQAPATTPTRHRTRPARTDQGSPPALSIHRTLESKLRDTKDFSPSSLQPLAASYHSSSTQESSIKSPSASAKNRGSTRLLGVQAKVLEPGASRQTKAVRKATPKSSDQDQPSAESDGDNSPLRLVSAPVSQSPFLVADEDNHNSAGHVKEKAALFWTRQGLHADTPSKSRVRQHMGEPVPLGRRWTRSQALEADLRKKQAVHLQSGGKRSMAAAGESECDDDDGDDGDDGDDEGSDGSDAQAFTDGDESPMPRTPSKITSPITELDNTRRSDDNDPFKDDSASQHTLRMRILGVHARTNSNPTSFKRRVAAVAGSGTDENSDGQYEQGYSDGDKSPIPRTPSKRMKQASDLQGLEAKSPSSPGSWLERWKLNTMMNHSSMKPPKASQDDIDPTDMLPAIEPSGALGYATPKRKSTVFLDNLDLTPSRPTIEGHVQGDENCEGTEHEIGGSEDNVEDDVRTPVKARPLRLDLAEMTDLQIVTDPQQIATADFQTPPRKHVRKDIFGQNMKPPPAPRGLSSGHRPMYFENMSASSPIAQKTLHLHRPPSEW
ncbi:hypothetical protein BGZ72_005938 [Mortierella alpina]|nr:hypothetical protein BGZ72_005938 [Mortierella alpina]